MTPTEILFKARNLIAKGWIQGVAKEGNSYSLDGAINYAHGKRGDSIPIDKNALKALELLAKEIYGKQYETYMSQPGYTDHELVMIFNDDPGYLNKQCNREIAMNLLEKVALSSETKIHKLVTQ